ncbi:FUSC family membrane protein [Robbsia sp. KACC 23696]|uniref:FUSC family protein n=1 Tax=Robbsia sp. KACC 23696 TaxID=3149231 RepID=UPI00325A455C
MRYSIEIRKFLYSQHLFSGLRISLGIVLPGIVMLFVFDAQELAFTVASGAIAASVVDLPGPLKYKHNEMLACSVLGFLSALITGIATANPLTLWLTVVPLTFCLSMIVMLGAKGPQISFATLYMMITTLEQHLTPLGALVNASWMLGGSLWYTYWSYLLSRTQIDRIERQVLGESVFSIADYLRARARFYDQATRLEDNYSELVDKQIAAVEQQDAARDIVLRRLPRLKRSDGDPRRVRLFNLFIDAVDLHETAISSHTDYALLRNTFGNDNPDLLIFFHDLLEKCADDLQEIGLAILQDRASVQRVRNRAELRAIEYEIDKMRRRNFPARDSEAYAAVSATFRRVWTVARMIDRLHRGTREADGGNKTETVMRVDQTLSRFLDSRRITAAQLLSNLTMTSPPFRHALRVTLGVAAALALGKLMQALLPLTNSYWIVLTTVIILKPGFSLTRQRNTQRIFGTILGCVASVVFLHFFHNPALILAVTFACMLMAYSLLLINYAAAVVFISSYVLLLYHLLAPVGMRLIGERAVDTIVGCMIAVGISYLFANWEYRLMGPTVKAALKAIRDYLDAVRQANAKLRATDLTSAQRQAQAMDRDYQFRLARKVVHTTHANLGQAFRRMMREPKSKRIYVAELNDLIVQCHALASHITAAAPLMASAGVAALPTTSGATLPERAEAHRAPGPDAKAAKATDGAMPVALEPAALRAALDAISHHLAAAEAATLEQAAPTLPGVPPIGVDAEANRAISRALDEMGVAADKAEANGDDPAMTEERVNDIKLLVYQTKQMLRAALLLRRDAAAIHLPLTATDTLPSVVADTEADDQPATATATAAAAATSVTTARASATSAPPAAAAETGSAGADGSDGSTASSSAAPRA